MRPALERTELPLPLVRRGKVRDVYRVDDERLLLVASDRISAFDVVLAPAIPDKGEVLTQLTAWWLARLDAAAPHHLLTADPAAIATDVPALRDAWDGWAGRAMLVRRTEPVPIECVVRGHLAGSAWREYARSGTLAGEPLPAGLRQSQRLERPLFSPATKAHEGHDENITFVEVERRVGETTAAELRDRSLALYAEGRATAEAAGIVVADTKFEFGHGPDGELVLIDEVLTPDSSRFWPRETYAPGRAQPSLDKQPVRDYLDERARAGEWDRRPPAPALPADVVDATTARYRELFRRLTGYTLDAFPLDDPGAPPPQGRPAGAEETA